MQTKKGLCKYRGFIKSKGKLLLQTEQCKRQNYTHVSALSGTKKRRADVQDKVKFCFCISFAAVLFYSFPVSTVLFVCSFPVEWCRERALQLGYASSNNPSSTLSDAEPAKHGFSFFETTFYFNGVGGNLRHVICVFRQLLSTQQACNLREAASKLRGKAENFYIQVH